jgi:transcriptional regulator with XRE-family HTH domain
MSDTDSSGSLERYLGNTIRDLRQKHGLTIADVASLAGISRGMLSKIENAQTATSLDTLSRLAGALGVSIATLFRGYDVRDGSAQLVKDGEGWRWCGVAPRRATPITCWPTTRARPRSSSPS